MQKLTKAEKKAQKAEAKRKEREDYIARVVNYNRVASKELANRSKEKKNHPGAYISIQEVNKIYDNLVQAVYDFSIDIKKNEFIVFVGPSGCGKSTTLRMVAGLEEITAGNLFIDGKYANPLPPKDRDIAMVFQSYALYPHMSVYDNMSFALKINTYDMPLLDQDGKQVIGIDKRHIENLEKELREVEKQIANADKYHLEGKTKEEIYGPLEARRQSILAQIEQAKNENVPLYESRKYTTEEIHDAVMEAAKILQIEEYLDRKPKALSGGQRQRVALGRAIVKKAKLFLMDEPLSNLDAKLRVSMRSEIKRIHQTIGSTTIYVTHDQTEAMTMADRIVIMEKGVIQQISAPKEIYNHPNNVFVATFIGSPAMNIIEVKVKDGKIDFGPNGVLTLPKDFVEAFKTSIESKINEIEELKAHGLGEEYKKEIEYKKETMAEEIKNGKFKNPGNDSNPFEHIVLTDDEKEMCQGLFQKKLDEVLPNEAKYRAMLESGEYEAIFGVRPEDVYLKDGDIGKKVVRSDDLKGKVTISELLGNEYFVHVDFFGKDFILKTDANNELKIGDETSIILDMNKIHLFDVVDKGIIK